MEEIREIWKDQKSFNENMLSYSDLNLQEKVEWSKNYALYLHKEVGEFMDDMPISWKVHRGKLGNSSNLIRSNLLEEWIDMFKYWLSMGLIWDFSPEEFIETYKRKSKVVEQRFKQERILKIKGNENLKVAGVDIDGVLADYPASFVEFINRTLGTNYDHKEVIDYNIYHNFGIPVEQGVHLKDLYRQTGQKRYINALSGARETLEWLKDNGYTIVLLTARPYKKYKRIYADTLEWLEKNEIPFDCIIWDEKKEERLIKEFGVEQIKFFVDDVTSNVEGISRLGVRSYLVTKPYNQSDRPPVNCKRIKSIKEVIDYESVDN